MIKIKKEMGEKDSHVEAILKQISAVYTLDNLGTGEF